MSEQYSARWLLDPDLLFAERALQFGAAVHVVLPVSTPEFLDRSVRVGDAATNGHWQSRFDAVMNQAQTITILEEDKPLKARLSFDEAVFVGNRHTAGLALLQADEWESEAVMVCVHDGSPPKSIAGTSRIFSDWKDQGHREISLACNWRNRSFASLEETVPSSFGSVLFIWLAVPGDRDRHQNKSESTINAHIDKIENLITVHLSEQEKPQRRTLAGQMIGVYVYVHNVMRAQALAAAISQISVPDLDGLRLVLDFGGVIANGQISEARLSALRGSRDNIELPIGSVMLTEAFAAEARLQMQEVAPFSQVGLQTRKSDDSLVPRSAIRYYRSA